MSVPKIDELLLNLGLNIASSYLYDTLRQIFSQSDKYTKQELIQKLSPYLKIENADIYAEKIINFLAQSGDIEIVGSNVFAKKAIHYSSGQSRSFSLKNSISQTDKTSVNTSNNGKVIGKNGAQVNQNEDGSIDFLLTTPSSSEINIYNSAFLIKKKI